MRTHLHQIACLLLVVLFAAKFQLHSQTFNYLAIPPGLSQHETYVQSFRNSMVLENDINVWYSTECITLSNGIVLPSMIVRYEEDNWKVFRKSEYPIPSDTIYSLNYYENKLYIATAQGVAIYDGNWEFINRNHGLPVDKVSQILVTPNSLILGTFNGLCIYENGAWQHYHTGNSGIVGNMVNTLLLDGNMLWIGTNSGLSGFDGNNFHNFTHQNSALDGNDVIALALEPGKGLWISIENQGLYRLAEGHIQPYNEIYELMVPKNQSITALATNADGKILTLFELAIMNSHRIARFDEHKTTLFRNSLNNRLTHLLPVGNFAYAHLKNYPNLLLINMEALTPKNHFDVLQINDVKAGLSSIGTIANDYEILYKPVFEIPVGGGAHGLFSHNIWLGGKNHNNELHIAVETYGQIGHDFFPGPITRPQFAYQLQQDDWNFLWKLKRSEIDYHKSNWWRSGYQMPNMIANWPAHGDTVFGQQWYLAPYTDMNSNGLYEPDKGDFPNIRGDQAVFFVANDHAKSHTQSGGQPLEVEIRGMVYGFNAPHDEVLNRTVLINYQLINQSHRNYKDVYLGLFTDFAIGYEWDNYIGCDTTLNAFYAYNALPIDGDGAEGTYGDKPPAMGVAVLNNSLYSFKNQVMGWAWPEGPQYYYNILNGLDWFGQPIVIPGTDSQTTKFEYSGDPADNTGWTELNHNNGEPNKPGGRRGVGSIHIGDFLSGQRLCLDIAFVFGQDPQGNHLESVRIMKQNIQHIKAFYEQNISNDCNDLLATSITESVETSNTLQLYPNPAIEEITIEFPDPSHLYHYRLLNTMGISLMEGYRKGKKLSLTIKDLPAGLYILVVEGQNGVSGSKFIKHK